MKMTNIKSIRFKFTLVTLLSFCLLTSLILYFWYASLSSEAERTAKQNMDSIIQISNNIFENEVKDISNVVALSTVQSGNYLQTNIINILSQPKLTDAELVTYRKEANDYLTSLCSFKKYLNGLMISDFSGNNITYGIPTSFSQIKDADWYQKLKKPGSNQAFVEPHYDNQWSTNENDMVFSIVQPVYSTNKKAIGFALADIKCQLLKDSFEVSGQNNMSLYLVEENSNQVIFSPKSNPLSTSVLSTVNSDISKHFTQASGSFFVTVSGRRMLFVYHKSSFTKWVSLCVVPQEDIVKNFTQAKQNILMITALFLSLMVVIIFLSSNLLTRNIVMLTKSIKKIGRDSLTLDVQIRSNDEVGELYTQFEFMLSRVQQLITEVKEKESARRSAYILALQSQINPHFLYNTLNTIKFLAALKGENNIVSVSENFSSLLHVNLSPSTFIPIKEEISYIKNYFAIESFRYSNQFQYRIQIEDNLDEKYIPKLIVQPLVENSLKHGLDEQKTDFLIVIKFFTENDRLHIRVEDNGLGMSEETIQNIFDHNPVKNQNSKSAHIGLKNVDERIKIYFGDEYGLKIQSQLALFTRQEVCMPLLGQEDLSKYA